MIRGPDTVWEQVLNGIFKAFYILFLPIILVYKILSWFMPAVAKETGNKIVQIIGWIIATGIVGYLLQYFFNYTLK